MYQNDRTTPEVWAVLLNGQVCWSRGGSSTKAHLMVYPTKAKAEAGLRNSWTKQVIDPDTVTVELIRGKGDG